MFRFKDESERSFELLEDKFNQIGEGHILVGPRVVEVLGENCDGLRVCFRLEFVAPLLEDQPELGAVGDDTIVNDTELICGIRTKRVTINLGRWAMGRPSGMRDGDLGNQSLSNIEGRSTDLLAQARNFADFFEVNNITGLVTVDTETS